MAPIFFLIFLFLLYFSLFPLTSVQSHTATYLAFCRWFQVCEKNSLTWNSVSSLDENSLGSDTDVLYEDVAQLCFVSTGCDSKWFVFAFEYRGTPFLMVLVPELHWSWIRHRTEEKYLGHGHDSWKRPTHKLPFLLSRENVLFTRRVVYTGMLYLESLPSQAWFAYFICSHGKNPSPSCILSASQWQICGMFLFCSHLSLELM